MNYMQHIMYQQNKLEIFAYFAFISNEIAGVAASPCAVR